MQPPAVLELLGDPVRWQIVTELGRSDRRVGELVELVDRPQNVVSYHLAALRRAGLVDARRSSADARDVYYRAELTRCRDLLQDACRSLHAGLADDPPRPGRSVPRRPRVLFVCTGNSARSQIAEALADHRSAGAVAACSAGTHPKPLHPNAVRVMAERGIDIAGRPSTSLTRFARRRFDRVITLCDRAREDCLELPATATVAHWSIVDPAAGGSDHEATYPAFVDVADEIERRVALLLAELHVRPIARSAP